jgi:hypothetical protein
MIKLKLIQMGYHPRLHPGNKGTTVLVLSRKNEIVKLLQLLPLRHREKIRKRQLLLTTRSATYWDEIKDKVSALKGEIEREIKSYVREAKEEFLKRGTLHSRCPNA